VANTWWLVYYQTGSVAGRYITPSEPSYKVVQAASSSAAAKMIPLGSGLSGQPQGPYATKAAAQAAANANSKTIASEEQGGSTTGGGSSCLVSLPIVGCVFRKTQARALVGGLIIAGSAGAFALGILVLVSSALGHTSAGQHAGKLAGDALEGAGAVTAAAGFPEVGAPIAAAGSGVKRAAGHAQGKAGAKAQARRDASRADKAELKAKGASNIRTARKEPGTLGRPTHPGRKTGSVSPSTDTPPF
jgi:hypothetical protein